MSQNKKPNTIVECYLTACKYNTACCINPSNANQEFYCTKNNIKIDLDEDTDNNLNFSCTSFVNGHKEIECLKCIEEKNDGEIPLDDIDPFEFEIEIDDDDDDILQ